MMERYRDIGFKLTPQRLAILEYLEGNSKHPSAEEIYASVRGSFPTMSFATVYNTIEALKDKGKVLELTIDPERKRYDPNTGAHHHIICVKCRKIVDVMRSFDVELSEGEKAGYRLIGSHIEFYGICQKCD